MGKISSELKGQHPAVKNYLLEKNKGKRVLYDRETSLGIKEFSNADKTLTVDFIVCHKKSIELIECKIGSGHWYIYQALGQLLIYKTMLLMGKHLLSGGNLKNKNISLSLCMVHGYGEKNGIWTSAHEKLRKILSRKILGDLSLYLVIPREVRGNSGRWKQNWARFKYHRCIGPFKKPIPSEYLAEKNLSKLIEYSGRPGI